MSCGCGKKAVATPEQIQDSSVTLEQLAEQTKQLEEQRRSSQRNALSNAGR